MRSIIRWAGSKRKLIPQIESYWRRAGDGRRYVEAFAGSAAFLFHANPSVSIINDSNKDLIGALTALKFRPKKIHEKLSAIENSEKQYYELRALDSAKLNADDRAVRFFYLNRFCFNGIYRVNNNGRFNVPYSSSKTGGIPSLDEWLVASKILRKTGLFCEDFESFCLREAGSSDFVYLDPPYAVSNRRVFSQYGLNSFGLKDMQRLSSLMREMDARGAKFLVSYASSPEGDELAKGWKIETTQAMRNVAGFRKHRNNATEFLISNF